MDHQIETKLETKRIGTKLATKQTVENLTKHIITQINNNDSPQNIKWCLQNTLATMKMVESVSTLSGEEKKQLVITILKDIITNDDIIHQIIPDLIDFVILLDKNSIIHPTNIATRCCTIG